jgi:hypothetical protein
MMPKNIRFDDYILEEAKRYQLQKNISFSELVRLALQSYLRRKMYSS